MRRPPTSSSPRNRREDGSPSRWDQYVDLLSRKRVPEKARRWYVVHVEAFLKALRPESLKVLTKAQITGYLQEASGAGNLHDWQFRQLVDSIQLLVVDLAQLPVGREIDWDYWKEAGKPLEPDHSTIAREVLDAKGRSPGPQFGKSAGSFPVLEELARTLRSRHYAIRTEKTYVQWCHRFLLFYAGKPLDAIGPEDVQRFLTHLAVDRTVAASTQNLAYNSVSFLFSEVLENPLDELRFARAKRPARLPVISARTAPPWVAELPSKVTWLKTGYERTR